MTTPNLMRIIAQIYQNPDGTWVFLNPNAMYNRFRLPPDEQAIFPTREAAHQRLAVEMKAFPRDDRYYWDAPVCPPQEKNQPPKAKPSDLSSWAKVTLLSLLDAALAAPAPTPFTDAQRAALLKERGRVAIHWGIEPRIPKSSTP